MKKIVLAIFLLASSMYAQTAALSGYCNLGASQALTSGLSSSNYQQGLIPSCTVTVYLTGTTTLATIYSDSSSTSLTNPFTANTDASWSLYAAIGQGYDIVLSGGTSPNVYPSPVTIIGVYSLSATSIAVNLSGTVVFSVPYQSASETTSYIAPNITTTPMALTMTGTGSAGAAPIWSSITGLNGISSVLTTTQTMVGELELPKLGVIATDDLTETAWTSPNATNINALDVSSLIYVQQQLYNIYDATSSAIAIPSTATSYQVNAFASYIANSTAGSTNGVSMYPTADCIVSLSRCWALNPLVEDRSTNINSNLWAEEVDVNIFSATTEAYGIQLVGRWGAQPTRGYGVIALDVAKPVSSSGSYYWTGGLQFEAGATSSGNAITLLPQAAAGPTSPSQVINFFSWNAASSLYQAAIYADALGAFTVGTAGGNLTYDRYGNLNVANTTTNDGAPLGNFLQASLPTGDFNDVFIGVANSSYNSAEMQFNYVGAASTANSFGLGLYGNNAILNLFGTNDMSVGTTSDMSKTLYVNGTFEATGISTFSAQANFAAGVAVGGGGNTVYRCLTAGTAPAGTLTYVTSVCGTYATTSLTIN